MRELVLPDGIAPGSLEAVEYIESQVLVLDEPFPAPAAVVASRDEESGLDLIIAGLEMMIDGFKELRNA